MLSSYYLNEVKDNVGTYDQDYELLKQQEIIEINKKLTKENLYIINLLIFLELIFPMVVGD